jgi:hypothetical protein
VYFAPGAGSRWSPAIVGAARVTYSDAKLGVDETREVVVWTPITDGAVPVDWEHAEPADFSVADLSRTPIDDRPFDPLPAAATAAKKYAQWTKEFTQWAARAQTLELLRSSHTGRASRADESERDFRVRLNLTLREQRDAEMVKVRERYASKLIAADDRVRRAQVAVARQQQQASESKMQAGVSMAATVFGAILGRRAVSASTLGRATTAARGVSRVGREAQDVVRAEEELKVATSRREELAAALERELQTIGERWDAARDEPLERTVVKPKRGGVSVQLVALVWRPT